jgi:hypothetical protein
VDKRRRVLSAIIYHDCGASREGTEDAKYADAAVDGSDSPDPNEDTSDQFELDANLNVWIRIVGDRREEYTCATACNRQLMRTDNGTECATSDDTTRAWDTLHGGEVQWDGCTRIDQIPNAQHGDCGSM